MLNGRSGPITILGHDLQRNDAGMARATRQCRDRRGVDLRALGLDEQGRRGQRRSSRGCEPAGASSAAELFVAKCATCHQANGQGTSAYPPLAGNPDVTATDPKSMIATVVNGRSGPLVVAGTTFNGKMPTWKGQLSNADIAAVLTYVRGAWGNKAAGVTEQQVASAGPVVSSAVGMSIFGSKCAACHQASGKGGGGGLYPGAGRQRRRQCRRSDQNPRDDRARQEHHALVEGPTLRGRYRGGCDVYPVRLGQQRRSRERKRRRRDQVASPNLRRTFTRSS